MTKEKDPIAEALEKAGITDVQKEKTAGDFNAYRVWHVVERGGKHNTAINARKMLSAALEGVPKLNGQFLLSTEVVATRGNKAKVSHLITLIPRGPPGKPEDAQEVLRRFGFTLHEDTTKGDVRKIVVSTPLPREGNAEHESAKKRLKAVLVESPSAFGATKPGIFSYIYSGGAGKTSMHVAKWKVGEFPPGKTPQDALAGTGFHYLPPLKGKPYSLRNGGWITVESVSREPAGETETAILQRRKRHLEILLTSRSRTFGSIAEHHTKLIERKGEGVRVRHMLHLEGRRNEPR